MLQLHPGVKIGSSDLWSKIIYSENYKFYHHRIKAEFLVTQSTFLVVRGSHWNFLRISSPGNWKQLNKQCGQWMRKILKRMAQSPKEETPFQISGAHSHSVRSDLAINSKLGIGLLCLSVPSVMLNMQHSGTVERLRVFFFSKMSSFIFSFITSIG